MKRIWLLVLLMAGSLVALNIPVFADEASTDSMEDVNAALGTLSNRVNTLEKKGPSLEVHGFAELDYIFDDNIMGLGTEIIGDSAQVPHAGGYQQNNGQAQFSPRNSRIDALSQTTVDGWATKGYVEGDFFGINFGANGAAVTSGSENTATGGSELKEYTQPTFRLRHAYLDAQKDGWDIMAGQYWTLFGWNADNVLATVDVQPIMGTIYERTPRLGVMKTFGDDAQVQIAVDAERPEQAFSMVPNFNAGIRFKLNDWTSQFSYATGASKLVPLSVGISGTYRTYDYLPTTAGAFKLDSFAGQGVAVDAQIPVLTATDANVKDNSTLILTGEWMIGEGVADALNGWNGGGESTPTDMEGLDAGIVGSATGLTNLIIDDQSWNAQLQFHLPQSIGTYLTFGYGEVYSDNARRMTGATYNDDNGIFVNVVQDFTNNIRAGVEYARFQDNYLNNDYGVDHRIQLSTWYRF
jgi:hypothetical protein